MNLKEQEYVCALAENGTITAAAKELFISQPALSIYINNLAKSLGADVVINSREEDPVAKVKALTGGRGADVVVEAAGTAESFNAASAMIRHNGKFVFYSWVTTPVNLNISRWHDDGLEFVNTCLVHHTWQERYVWVPDTLRPIIQGSVKIHPLITNEFRLENIRAGFDLADKDDAAIKIVFRP